MQRQPAELIRLLAALTLRDTVGPEPLVSVWLSRFPKPSYPKLNPQEGSVVLEAVSRFNAS